MVTLIIYLGRNIQTIKFKIGNGNGLQKIMVLIYANEVALIPKLREAEKENKFVKIENGNVKDDKGIKYLERTWRRERIELSELKEKLLY